jgi:hypothetical protein
VTPAAPDLIAPVVAFRAWRVVDDALLSPYIPCRWDGPVMHAECYPANRALLFGRGWLAEPHDPPHRDCRCGIYAYHRPGTQTYFGEWEWTEGIVTAWGRIEAHATGLRAQHARVEALGLPPSNEPTRRRSVQTIAERLGVRLVPRDDLAEAAVDHGAPLPDSLLP